MSFLLSLEKEKFMETLIVATPYEIERKKPMPSKNHSFIQSNLIFLLQLHYRNKYRIASELSLDLMGWESVPDLCIYAPMPMDLLHDEIELKEPPLAVIEIISPTQSLQELVNKAEKYFRSGVQSCWLVLPAVKNIYVFSTPTNYHIFKADETLIDDCLAISLPLAEAFA